MTDLNLLQYLFDVQGYLVIENALSRAEVAQLNRLLDGQQLPEPGHTQRFGSAPDGSGFLAWGQPFVNLLDHPRIMPILRLRLGDCFRLDRIYGMCMDQGMGRGRLHADYGATANNARTQQGEYVPFRDDQIYNGFVVVTWCLSDSGPGMGGFCCIPGSHKSNYKLPQQIDDAPDEAACVIIPEAPAGSAILFTEALTHGTAAWQAPHQRRFASLQILRVAYGLDFASRPAARQLRSDAAPTNPLPRPRRPAYTFPVTLRGIAGSLRGPEIH